MPKPKNYCRYCGGYHHNRTLCSHCAEKLKLIRKIQAMVRAEKQREEARSLVRYSSDKTTN